MSTEIKDLVKFDRKKPFGTVIPPHHGAHYEQGGFHFDHEGELVESLLGEADLKRLERLSKQREADKVAAEARAKFLSEEGLTEDDVKADPVGVAASMAAGAALDPSDVDLVAWAKGTLKIAFFKAVQAMDKQHHYSMTSRKAGVQWLVDEGIVSEEDAKF